MTEVTISLMMNAKINIEYRIYAQHKSIRLSVFRENYYSVTHLNTITQSRMSNLQINVKLTITKEIKCVDNFNISLFQRERALSNRPVPSVF